jgi:hypothetical protein
VIQKKILSIALLTWQLTGCGYTLQNSKNPLLLRTGIRKVYIEPVVNNTYKAGIENVVYNALVHALTEHGRIQIVQNKTDADAILQGQVTTALYNTSGSNTVASLSPPNLGSSSPLASSPIATIYTATLECNFMLTSTLPQTFIPQQKLSQNTPFASKTNPHPTHSGPYSRLKQKVRRPYAWSSHFTRSKPFPASNQLDVPGTTSVQINDSEFERTLAELARSMMADVHESMLSMF